MEEDIKVLEEYFNNICFDETNKITADLCTIGINEIRAIENLIKRYKELEEENKNIKNHIYYKEIVELNYIPKSKVREKIKEVNNSNENYTFYKLTSADIRKTITTNLEELLQEGDDK